MRRRRPILDRLRRGLLAAAVSCGALVGGGMSSVALAAAAPASGRETIALAGAGAEDDARRAELRRLRAAIEAEQATNDELRRRINDLRSSDREAWLRQERLEAIELAVRDVLADAEARTSMQSTGFSAGWDDGFVLRDPEGRFRLKLGGLVQFRYMLSKVQNRLNDRTVYGFDIPRSQIILSGNVFTRDLEYHIMVDTPLNEGFRSQAASNNLPPGEFILRDAWVRLKLTEHWAIRAGQFKLPFNREELVEPGFQQAIERSLINEGLNLGRSQGIELSWSGDTFQWAFSINDGPTDDVGGGNPRLGLIFDDPPTNSPFSDNFAEWAFATRAEWLLAGNWEQFRDFTSPQTDRFGLLIGVGGHMMKEANDGAASFTGRRNEDRWYGLTVDASAEFGGANLFASFYYQYLDRPVGQIEITGAVFQGGYYIAPRHELYARWELGSWELDTTGFADLNLMTVGWNWFLDGHDLKWSTDFGFAESIVDVIWNSLAAGWRRDQRGDEHQWLIRTRFQMIF